VIRVDRLELLGSKRDGEGGPSGSFGGGGGSFGGDGGDEVPF
jgi:single-strand DNA-binding protein